jgi:predicted XRE-type DNA-binding protein
MIAIVIGVSLTLVGFFASLILQELIPEQAQAIGLYCLIPIIGGGVTLVLSILFLILMLHQVPSDADMDHLIQSYMTKYLEGKIETKYLLYHAIVNQQELTDKKLEVEKHYNQVGRDGKTRSNMNCLNAYFLEGKKITVEEYDFDLLSNFSFISQDLFYYQDIVKTSITHLTKRDGSKQTSFIINLPMGENFTDIISNNDENIKLAQDLVTVINNLLDERKIDATKVNEAMEVIIQGGKEAPKESTTIYYEPPYRLSDDDNDEE